MSLFLPWKYKLNRGSKSITFSTDPHSKAVPFLRNVCHAIGKYLQF